MIQRNLARNPNIRMKVPSKPTFRVMPRPRYDSLSGDIHIDLGTMEPSEPEKFKLTVVEYVDVKGEVRPASKEKVRCIIYRGIFSNLITAITIVDYEERSKIKDCEEFKLELGILFVERDFLGGMLRYKQRIQALNTAMEIIDYKSKKLYRSRKREIA